MQRCPIEPAPWRQQDGCQIYQRKYFESKNFLDVPKRNERSYQDIQSEIENRLNQLKNEHYGKDIKNLKQILEAMHHKGLLILQKKNPVIMKMILITLLVLESLKKEKLFIVYMKNYLQPSCRASTMKERNIQFPKEEHCSSNKLRSGIHKESYHDHKCAYPSQTISHAIIHPGTYRG